MRFFYTTYVLLFYQCFDTMFKPEDWYALCSGVISRKASSNNPTPLTSLRHPLSTPFIQLLPIIVQSFQLTSVYLSDFLLLVQMIPPMSGVAVKYYPKKCILLSYYIYNMWHVKRSPMAFGEGGTGIQLN